MFVFHYLAGSPGGFSKNRLGSSLKVVCIRTLAGRFRVVDTPIRSDGDTSAGASVIPLLTQRLFRAWLVKSLAGCELCRAWLSVSEWVPPLGEDVTGKNSFRVSISSMASDPYGSRYHSAKDLRAISKLQCRDLHTSESLETEC